MTYFEPEMGKPVPVTIVGFWEGGNMVTQVKKTAATGRYDVVLLLNVHCCPDSLNFIYLHLIVTRSTKDETINHTFYGHLLVGRLIFIVY